LGDVAADAAEIMGTGDAFEIKNDDAGGVVVAHEFEGVHFVDVGLVAEADEGGEAHLVASGHIDGTDAEGAGLGDKGDAAGQGWIW